MLEFILRLIYTYFSFRQWEKESGNIVSIGLASRMYLNNFTGVNIWLVSAKDLGEPERALH